MRHASPPTGNLVPNVRDEVRPACGCCRPSSPLLQIATCPVRLPILKGTLTAIGSVAHPSGVMALTHPYTAWQNMLISQKDHQ